MLSWVFLFLFVIFLILQIRVFCLWKFFAVLTFVACGSADEGNSKRLRTEEDGERRGGKSDKKEKRKDKKSNNHPKRHSEKGFIFLFEIVFSLFLHVGMSKNIKHRKNLSFLFCFVSDGGLEALVLTRKYVKTKRIGYCCVYLGINLNFLVTAFICVEELPII